MSLQPHHTLSNNLIDAVRWGGVVLFCFCAFQHLYFSFPFFCFLISLSQVPSRSQLHNWTVNSKLLCKYIYFNLSENLFIPLCIKFTPTKPVYVFLDIETKSDMAALAAKRNSPN